MYNNGNSSKNVTGASIVDGTVANVDIDASAAIAQSKLATLVITNTEVADNALSGDKIDAGVISNFQSTGIDDNATSTAITIDSSENVGIGTSSPATYGVDNAEDLVIGQADGSHGLTISSWNASKGTVAFNDGTNGTVGRGYLEYDHSSNAMTVGTNGTERMRIDSSGNVGIGSASDGANLFIYESSTGVAQTIKHGNSTGGTTGTMIAFQNIAGTQIGSITGTGSVAYNTSSDYRLKENVVPMTGSIDRLKALKPSNFNFIADANITVDGFLAHEAQEVVPECATGTKDAMTDRGNITDVDNNIIEENVIETTELQEGQVWTKTGEVEDYQGIDQSKLVPLLVGALQEAITRIETLENA
jgi:hypothetical protein